jgi:hypothetical protein
MYTTKEYKAKIWIGKSKDWLFDRWSWPQRRRFAYWVERLASLIGASQPIGLDQRSGVVGSTTTATGTSRRWRSGCATSSRPAELRSNAGSTNTDKEQDDEPNAQPVSTRATESYQCQ